VQHAKAIESTENHVSQASSVLLAGEDPSQSQDPTPGSSQVPTLPGQLSFQKSTNYHSAGGPAMKRKPPQATGESSSVVSSIEALANTSAPESLAYLRLLVCDDQLLVRTCVRQFLQGIPGIKVVWEASNGRAGW
jgi:hypothetical protein